MIRDLLGSLTQEEMAMILEINRSQWSMYESGKRALPIKAKLLLAELLQHVKHAPDNAKAATLEDIATLDAKIKENEYLRLRLDRQIAAESQRESARAIRRKLAEFFEKRQPAGEEPSFATKVMAYRMEQDRAAESSGALFRLEMKKERLESEFLILSSKKRNIEKQMGAQQTVEWPVK